MSFAAALGLPLVVVVQNNQIALGTRVEVHTRAALDSLHMAYGVKGYTCDGNNVLDTYAATVQAVTDCRKGRGPVLLTANTFRMGGHATHDEAEARELIPQALFRYWGERDPIGQFETHLLQSEIGLETGLEPPLPEPLADERASRNRAVLEAIAQQAESEVEAAAAAARASRDDATPDGQDVDHGVYARPCE